MSEYFSLYWKHDESTHRIPLPHLHVHFSPPSLASPRLILFVRSSSRKYNISFEHYKHRVRQLDLSDLQPNGGLPLTSLGAPRGPPPDPWYFRYPPMHVWCYRYGIPLPRSPVVSIIQQAHIAASKEGEDTPLPGPGITYIGLVVEPLGRLLFSIVNEPLIKYGQWEETLLALRIFVGTFQPVEFGFQVAMDTGIGRPVTRIGSGMLVASANLPNSEAS